MDRIAEYRRLIRDIINKYAQFPPSHGDVEVETVFDETNDHYELMYSGWHGPQRIHGSVIHVDIRGGKIWIQHDGIEEGIADQFVAAGVPRDQIVLAFKEPDLRQYTDFAVT